MIGASDKTMGIRSKSFDVVKACDFHCVGMKPGVDLGKTMSGLSALLVIALIVEKFRIGATSSRLLGFLFVYLFCFRELHLSI